MGATCSTRSSTLNATRDTSTVHRETRERNRNNTNRLLSPTNTRNGPVFLSISPSVAASLANSRVARRRSGLSRPLNSTANILINPPSISQSDEASTRERDAREQQQQQEQQQRFDVLETDQVEVERLQQELALMEAFFQSFLNGNAQPNGQFNPFAQVAQQDVAPETANHPTSQKALRQIPTVSVTAEDLVDENNRECCICLDEIALGSRVSRLPCGHMFHQNCVTDWLEKHNTCCICRYELETDDPEYERIRLEKMRHRKPRFRDYELQRMSVKDLQEWCRRLRIDRNNAVEKTGLIDAIKTSGKIDLIAAPKPLDYRISDLRKMGVSDLKKVLNDAGVFFDPVNVVEKEDLVQIFINSGRLNPIPEVEVLDLGSDMEEDGDKKVAHKKREPEFTFVDNNDGDRTMEDDDVGISVVGDVPAHADVLHRSSTYEGVPSATQPSLAARTISELKSFARELGIDIHDCVEKREIVERIANVFSEDVNNNNHYDATRDGEPARTRRRF